MRQEEFLQRSPHLWHVAPAGAWEAISKLGIRTAESLIRDSDLSEEEKRVLLTSPRRTAVTLTVSGNRVTIRDQGRLFQRRDLRTILADGMTEADWVGLLNQRVYLFADRTKRDQLLGKYLELDGAQEVLSFSPLRLFKAASAQLELAAQNTGSIARRSGPQKDWETFVPISRFPADRKPAEVTVKGGLSDLGPVVEVRRHYRDGRIERLHP